jgi:hypothetical protein
LFLNWRSFFFQSLSFNNLTSLVLFSLFAVLNYQFIC